MKFTGIEATAGRLVWYLVCNRWLHTMIVPKDTLNIKDIPCKQCKGKAA